MLDGSPSPNSNVAIRRGPTARILAVFEASPDGEFNPTTIARRTKLPLNKVTSTLCRLWNKGKNPRIWKPSRGFYCLRPQLTRRQLIIHEARVSPQFHNLTLHLSTPLPVWRQQNKATVPPDAVAFPRAKWTKSLSIGPDRTLTLIGYRESMEARLGASENPLLPREVFWLVALLEAATGTSWRPARTPKADINIDLPVSLAGLQELTLGDLEAACLAIYRKGNSTRMELRNHRLEVTVGELLDNLAHWAGLEKQHPNIAIGRSKSKESNPEATSGVFRFVREVEAVPVPLESSSGDWPPFAPVPSKGLKAALGGGGQGET